MVKGVCLFFGVMVFIIFQLAFCLDDQIIKYTFNTNGLGTYSFEYETSGGTYRREDGGFVTKPGGSSMVIRGEYGYKDPQGRLYSMKYVADANGYQPVLNDDDTRFNDRRII